ncbi:MAG: hypothetical protein V7459_02090 [Oceanicoccus sp.]
MNSRSFSFGKIPSFCGGMCVALLCNTTVFAQDVAKNDLLLLDESEYRSDIEEVVVVGRQPEWRRKIDDGPEWRQEKFKLPEDSTPSSRIQWLPEYTEDERDNYKSVRDPREEKAGFKLFEWKF